jgi:hypothetical protein
LAWQGKKHFSVREKASTAAAAISYVSHEASFHYGKKDTLFPHGLSFLPAAKKD